MPAKGKVGESAAIVARPLQSEHFMPLSHMRGLQCLARLKDVLDVVIFDQNPDAKMEKKEKEQNRTSRRSNNFTVSILTRNHSALFFHHLSLAYFLLHIINHVHRHSRSNRQ